MFIPAGADLALRKEGDGGGNGADSVILAALLGRGFVSDVTPKCPLLIYLKKVVSRQMLFCCDCFFAVTFVPSKPIHVKVWALLHFLF